MRSSVWRELLGVKSREESVIGVRGRGGSDLGGKRGISAEAK